MASNISNTIQNQVDRKTIPYIRTKIRLRQVSDIYCEMIKIRDGESKYLCDIRNMLQIFCGEMELYCDLDTNKEIIILAKFLDEGISDINWEEVNNIVLQLYELVLRKCSILFK